MRTVMPACSPGVCAMVPARASRISVEPSRKCPSSCPWSRCKPLERYSQRRTPFERGGARARPSRWTRRRSHRQVPPQIGHVVHRIGTPHARSAHADVGPLRPWRGSTNAAYPGCVNQSKISAAPPRVNIQSAPTFFVFSRKERMLSQQQLSSSRSE